MPVCLLQHVYLCYCTWQQPACCSTIRMAMLRRVAAAWHYYASDARMCIQSMQGSGQRCCRSPGSSLALVRLHQKLMRCCAEKHTLRCLPACSSSKTQHQHQHQQQKCALRSFTGSCCRDENAARKVTHAHVTPGCTAWCQHEEASRINLCSIFLLAPLHTEVLQF